MQNFNGNSGWLEESLSFVDSHALLASDELDVLSTLDRNYSNSCCTLVAYFVVNGMRSDVLFKFLNNFIPYLRFMTLADIILHVALSVSLREYYTRS